jgi:flagellar biosynthesis protein FliR
VDQILPVPWFGGGALPVVAAGLFVRVAAAVEVVGPALLPGVSGRTRLAAASVLSAAALPAALHATSAVPTAEWSTLLPVLGLEACVGVASGLVVAALVGAVGWAGEILGGASGLAWSDADADDPPGTSAGFPRLARVAALGAFVVAGGLEGVVVALVDGVGRLPVGTAGAPGTLGSLGSLGSLAIEGTAAAVSLAVALALPMLLALLVFHLVTALALRVGACESGPGLLHAASALVLLAMFWHGADAWTGVAGPRLLPLLERHLDPPRASLGSDTDGGRPTPGEAR